MGRYANISLETKRTKKSKEKKQNMWLFLGTRRPSDKSQRSFGRFQDGQGSLERWSDGAFPNVPAEEPE